MSYSWQHRRRRSRSTAYTRTPSQDRQGSNDAYSEALRFIRGRLFAFTRNEFTMFANFYGRTYGPGSEKYLRQTFDAWRCGQTSMSGQTERRILECVPRLLSPSDRFRILSIYIPLFYRQLHAQRVTAPEKIGAIHTVYAAALARCEQEQPKFDWFVPGIFNNEELAQFSAVVRYTYSDRLYHSYVQVREDVSRLAELLSTFDGAIDAYYEVRFLEFGLILDTSWRGMPEHPFPPPAPPQIVTEHFQEYRRIVIV